MLPVVRQGNICILPHDWFRIERPEGDRWQWIGHSILKQFTSELVAELLRLQDPVRASSTGNKGDAA